MDYEKKYKEANDKVAVRFGSNVAKEIFADLYESEDERIRKELIEHIKANECADYVLFKKFSPDDVIAWLEKQGEKSIKASYTTLVETGNGGINALVTKELPTNGCNEQKPVNDTDEDIVESVKDTSILDLVEPKFHEDDWVVWQDKCYKVNYNGCGYELIDQDGLSTSLEYGTVEESAHLWDITKDAKDGDVLCTYECGEPKIVFILKGVPKKHCALSYYCYYNIMYPHFDSDSKKGCLAPNDKDVKPATKEQRDLLFAKMNEAGYEWDAEKKESKQIKVNTIWSEEDEKILNTTISFLSEYAAKGYENAVMCMDWLKSLKDRIK